MAAELVTRVLGSSAKGLPLTNEEVDQNFLNLAEEIDRVEQTIDPVSAGNAIIFSIALG